MERKMKYLFAVTIICTIIMMNLSFITSSPSLQMNPVNADYYEGQECNTRYEAENPGWQVDFAADGIKSPRENVDNPNPLDMLENIFAGDDGDADAPSISEGFGLTFTNTSLPICEDLRWENENITGVGIILFAQK